MAIFYSLMAFLFFTTGVTALLFPITSFSKSSISLLKHCLPQLDCVRAIPGLKIPKVRVPSRLRFRVSDNDGTAVEDLEEVVFDTTASDVAGVMKRLSSSIIPLAASVGFAVTPSPMLAARVAGAAAGGVAGFVLKKVAASNAEPEPVKDISGPKPPRGGSGVAVEVSRAVKALMNIPPSEPITLKLVEKAAKIAKIKPDMLSELFTQLFAEVLYRALMNDSEDLTILSDVTDFVSTLRLTKDEVGDGFVLAMAKIGALLKKDSQGFYKADSEDFLFTAAKALFVGDKLIGLDGFYGKRMMVSLSLFPTDSYKSVITTACTGLFRKAIEAVLTLPDTFTTEEIRKLREFLVSSPFCSDFRPADMQNMIMEILQKNLDNQLKLSDNTCMEASISNVAQLRKAQEVLGWDIREFDETFESRTIPVFEKATRQIINEVVDQPERAQELAEQLQERCNALNVDVIKAKVILTKVISEKNSLYMDTIDKVYNSSAGSIEPAFKMMVTYTTQHEAMKTVMEAIIGEDSAIPIPGLPFTEIVRASMYKLQLEGGSEAVNNEMFALNDEQRRLVKMNLALPKVSSWITQCINEGNFATGAKAAYEKLLDSNGVTAAQWKATAVDFYYQETKRIAEARAIPSEADMKRLEDVKKFLSVPEESAERVALELLGDKFVKALTESMMPSGVITEEYVQGLRRLQNRLGISNVNTEKLLGLAVRQRMIPVVKDLVDQWKIAIGVSKRKDESKDKSGDPISNPDNVLGYMETGSQKPGGGPNVFMREALNLIDFVGSNYGALGINLEQTEEFPVNSVGIVPEADLSEMFKHYVITRLTEQDANLRERYIADEGLFAQLLGLDMGDQARVKESLAYTAFRNMLKSVFRFKDAVEANDLSQFALLRENLGLNESACERVLNDASRSAVIEEAATLFMTRKGKTQAIEPAIVSRFRKQVQSLGLSLKNDAGFNDKLLSYLFALEVQALVENGLEAELPDVQEAYEIPVEAAEPIVAAVCQKYVGQLLNLALRASRQYKEEECTQWVREILKYAVFFEGAVDADGLMFSQEDKERLISFYESGVGLASAGEHEAVVRLRTLIALKEDFSPPKFGIDGLLVNDASLLGTNAKADLGEAKKRWAWN